MDIDNLYPWDKLPFMELKTWVAVKRGRASKLARAIGVPPSFISRIIDEAEPKRVPIEQCVPIERFTQGAVTCEEMRPDKAADFAYLRGLQENVATAGQGA